MTLTVHRQVALAKLRGELVPQPCAHCGSAKNINAHHTDYSQPLRVVWLCRRCHLREHNRLRRAGTPLNNPHRPGGTPKLIRLDPAILEKLQQVNAKLPMSENACIQLAILRLWEAEFDK